jgi:hypothetical protein
MKSWKSLRNRGSHREYLAVFRRKENWSCPHRVTHPSLCEFPGRSRETAGQAKIFSRDTAHGASTCRLKVTSLQLLCSADRLGALDFRAGSPTMGSRRLFVATDTNLLNLSGFRFAGIANPVHLLVFCDLERSHLA